ncbi:MAG: LysM peptidoglycan-binding domain-containing protein [Microscillaceae bacterium]|nr:LysM peptidoglycan-binding domain-containing protein [Microscillaceae bacterium]
MKNSAWSFIEKVVAKEYGWHFYTMALMDGYHSVSLFVENRPEGGIFLYFADQNFTAITNLLEPGSVAGFRRYSASKFDDYLLYATQSFWDSYFETKKKENPALKGDDLIRVADSRTDLTIWKLKRKGNMNSPPVSPVQTYIVKPGDTLFGIAKKTGVTVAEIKRLNNLKNEVIKPEQVLKLK